MNDKSVTDMTGNEKNGPALTLPPGESLATVALATGVSKSTVSRILAGKYPQDSDPYRKVEAYLKAKWAALDTNNAPVVPMPPADYDGPFITVGQKLMSAVLQAAVDDLEWLIVDGATGMGKSHCLKAFHAAHPDAIRIKAHYGQSVGAVLEALCRAMKLPVSGSLETRQARILAAAQGKKIVVDEADLLVVGKMGDRVMRVMELFREIYEAGAVVILVGLPVLSEQLAKSGETYMFSRIGYFRSIKPPTDEEMTEFFIRHAADMPHLHDKAALAASRARRFGLFRYLDKLIKRTRLLDGNLEQAMTLLYRPEV